MMCRSVTTVGADRAVIAYCSNSAVIAVIPSVVVDEEYEIRVANARILLAKYELEDAIAENANLASKLVATCEEVARVKYDGRCYLEKFVTVNESYASLQESFNQLNEILTDTVSQFDLTSKQNDLEIVSLQRQVLREKRKSFYTRKSLRPSIRKVSAVSRIFGFVRCSLFGK